MNEFIKMLDTSLRYKSHEYREDRVEIIIEFVREKGKCPYVIMNQIEFIHTI